MHVRPPTILRRLSRDEQGFTMIIALVALIVGGLLAAAALLAATQDVTLTSTYVNQQKAYSAALAGINEYKYQLSSNPNYWASCPEAEGTVTGAAVETYKVKTLPSTSWVAKGNKKCESGKQLSIIETADSASGTFRIESTGTITGSKCGAQLCSRTIVATLTHPGYLNYVYLSNFEEADPETLGRSESECEYYHEEREEKHLTSYCVSFPWIPADKIEGPFHTNDKADIDGSPTFGRSGHNDSIEMNRGCEPMPSCAAKLKEDGDYTENGATLLPPEVSATELLTEAGDKFTGRTTIVLKEGTPNKMEVTKNNGAKETISFPSNGVVSVVNSASGCPIAYTPFLTKYTGDTECGNVYIKGKYTESLTVIAQNDVIVTGNLTTEGGESGGQPTGAATLGLIAIQHARLYHPVKETCEKSGKKVTCEASEDECNDENAAKGETPAAEFGESLKNPDIDAAILSTKHSWGVDNYSCGKELGDITIWGSIAENWRGRVTCCTQRRRLHQELQIRRTPGDRPAPELPRPIDHQRLENRARDRASGNRSARRHPSPMAPHRHGE